MCSTMEEKYLRFLKETEFLQKQVDESQNALLRSETRYSDLVSHLVAVMDHITSPNPVVSSGDARLLVRVDSIGLSARTLGCVRNCGIERIGELVLRTESDLLRRKNFGRKSLGEVRDVLSSWGLRLK